MNKRIPRRLSISLRTAVLVVTTGVLAGCSSTPSSSSPHAAASSNAPLSLNGCAPSDVPSGFVLDGTHSGTMSPAQYSASGDIQASLIFDHFLHGLRNVYTNLATPNPQQGGDLVVECVAMQFSTTENANRFLQSFEYLRSQAGSIVTKVALPSSLSGDEVGYQEQQQAFSGYHIASTTVMEVADQHGDEFYDVSVAGPHPTSSSAFGILKVLAGSA
jgi:hypothetical protein